MQHQSVSKYISVLLLCCSLSLTGCSGEEPAAKVTETATERPGAMSAEEIAALGNVIARVGDQAITFNQINTMLNSSAVVGVSVPALGTPQRDTARIVVLDKVVSANLLYLDAIRLGLDKDPAYLRDMQNFSEGMLGGQYYRQIMAGEILVSESVRRLLPQGAGLEGPFGVSLKGKAEKQRVYKLKSLEVV